MNGDILERLDICQAIIVDVLSGKNHNDIMCCTGLSVERCKEIVELFPKIFTEYKERHDIYY